LDGVEWLIFGIFNFDKGVEIGDTTRTAMVMGGGHWGLSGIKYYNSNDWFD
jgi:hypothetical protein